MESTVPSSSRGNLAGTDLGTLEEGRHDRGDVFPFIVIGAVVVAVAGVSGKETFLLNDWLIDS